MTHKKLCTSLGFTLLFFALPMPSHAQTHWVGSWAASQQLPEPNNSLPPDALLDATLRQIVHLSVGGNQIRVHISNRFGTAPLHFTAVHVARPISPASDEIVTGTDEPLAFSGKADVIIPAGADYISDPLSLTVAPLSDLAITLHLDLPPASQTGHPGSRATSYLAHGDLVSAATLPKVQKFDHWYFIAGVDVLAPPQAFSIVALGDSITDGHGAVTNANNRWPDLLASRLQSAPETKSIGVLNHGIGGNRVLLDSLGPNALARFDHDVLAQPGARFLLVLEGVNDIGMLTHSGDVPQADHDLLVYRIIAAYQQMISRAHNHGIQVIGCTILPFVGSSFYHPAPISEADRQAVNAWIRAAGHFDAFVDFDQVTRDPQNPDRLLPAYDSGDHLHPSPAGYAAMAEAIPLSLFSASSSAASNSLRIAFTFDDLPEHGPLPPGVTRADIANKILAALRAADLPPTYGFINAGRLELHPEDVSVFEAWRNAGYPLGNHTWLHMNLNRNSLEDFESQVTRNEPALNQWMNNEDWHWLRFPYLNEGDTAEKRAGIRTFLAQHGYKIAGITMDFHDYSWNGPYARCKAKGDTQAIESLESSYLAAADNSITYYRSLSQTLYHRDIPYVLLMHVGALDAEMLPRLLELYRSRGFTFISLAEAERDEFYRNDLDLSLSPNPDDLEQAMKARHLTPDPDLIPPDELSTTICQ